MSLFDQLQDLAAIDRLIQDAVRESETIEYKRADAALQDAALDEVAKDVSAFANSTGGVLIYGVRTQKDRDTMLPVERIPILEDNIDRIHRAIGAYIRHPVPGIRSKTLPVDGHPQALIIEVPASPLTPHQSIRDRRYYRRQGGDSVPMAHELLELYFGRRLGPWLLPDLRGTKQSSDARGFALALSTSLWLLNDGAGTAREIVVSIRRRNGVGVQIVHGASSNSYYSTRGEFGRLDELRAHPPELVIHPEDDHWILGFELRVGLHEYANVRRPELWVLHLSVLAANMRPRRFHVGVRWDAPLDPEFVLHPDGDGRAE